MSHCSVCWRDFARGPAKTKHESTCADSPPDLEAAVVMINKLTRKLDEVVKELNVLKRSRCAVKDNPISFPEITESDFWNFLDKGLVHLVCSKDWPLYVDGKRFMIYARCEESNEEIWKEASSDELDTFASKIYWELNAWFLKSHEKLQQNNKEGESIAHQALKLKTVDSAVQIKEAFIAAGKMFSD